MRTRNEETEMIGITEDDCVFARQPVCEVTRAKDTEPSTEFEDRDQPALGTRVVNGRSHSVVERLHANGGLV